MTVLVRPTSTAEERGHVQLDPQEEAAVQARIKAMDEILRETEKKASYKIELFLTQQRSMYNPMPGVMSFWSSGARLHGGGDSKAYFCSGKRLGRSECMALLTDKCIANDQHFCPSCGQVWGAGQSIGEHAAVLTMKNWAEVFLFYFIRLQHDADLVIKYAPEDIRTAAMLEQARQMGGDALRKARGRRAAGIYPLARIIRDCSSGASILGRFIAFLGA